MFNSFNKKIIFAFFIFILAYGFVTAADMVCNGKSISGSEQQIILETKNSFLSGGEQAADSLNALFKECPEIIEGMMKENKAVVKSVADKYGLSFFDDMSNAPEGIIFGEDKITYPSGLSYDVKKLKAAGADKSLMVFGKDKISFKPFGSNAMSTEPIDVGLLNEAISGDLFNGASLEALSKNVPLLNNGKSLGYLEKGASLNLVNGDYLLEKGTFQYFTGSGSFKGVANLDSDIPLELSFGEISDANKALSFLSDGSNVANFVSDSPFIYVGEGIEYKFGDFSNTGQIKFDGRNLNSIVLNGKVLEAPKLDVSLDPSYGTYVLGSRSLGVFKNEFATFSFGKVSSNLPSYSFLGRAVANPYYATAANVGIAIGEAQKSNILLDAVTSIGRKIPLIKHLFPGESLDNAYSGNQN